MAINGRNYGTTGPNENDFQKQDVVSSSSKTVNLGKVFGIMFIWLLLTAGIALGLGYLFARWLGSSDPALFNRTAFNTLWGVLIGSAITLIVLTFVIQFVALRKGRGKAMPILSFIYVVVMGTLCSSITLFIPWNILGMALGITTGIFGVLSLIGLLSKGRMTGVAAIGIMLILGGAMCALFTFLFTIWMPIANPMWYWIIDFAIFAGMLLMIIVDLNQIGKICEEGALSPNLTLYCALTLYTDFIYIFLKIAYYLAIFYGENK